MTKRFKLNEDLTCPELAGYKLPECKPEEEVEKLAELCSIIYKPENESDFENGFISGYQKAREKYIFPMETITKIREVLCNGVRENMSLASAIAELDKIVFNQLNKGRPVAIEVEMAKPSESFGAFIGNAIGEFVPATNPDGTVKATYIFEN